MMIVLIDTNILLDVIQERHPHHHAAARVWKLAEEGALTAHVAAISFNNVFYVARKQMGSVRAREVLHVVRKTFRLIPFDEIVLDRALATDTPDFEDAVQAAAAVRVSAQYVVTRNAKDFTSLDVLTVTAEELLAVLTP